MRALWIVEECVDRKWGVVANSDTLFADFIFINDTEEEGLAELALWQAEVGRYRLVKYTPVKK